MVVVNMLTIYTKEIRLSNPRNVPAVEGKGGWRRSRNGRLTEAEVGDGTGSGEDA